MNGSPPSNLTVEQTLVWALLALHTNGSAQTVQEGGETLPRFSYALAPNAIILRANLPLQQGWPGATSQLWTRVGEAVQGGLPAGF
jgi:hypothetical protein